MTLTPPGSVGRRLLPSYIDELAETNPDRIAYSIAKTKNPADGFQDISVSMFARAVNRCAAHIEKHLGRGEGFPRLAYMGPQDVVYAILTIACVKTGYVLMLNSVRNSLEAHLSVIDNAKCSTFLLPPRFSLPVLKEVLAARQMTVVEIPGVQHWLDESIEAPAYPFNKSFEDVKYEPFVTLHTSGSTGLPKLVTHTHKSVATFDAFTAIGDLGYQPVYPATCKDSRVYTTFPMFHLGGILAGLEAPFFCEYTVVLGPFPPSAEVANAVHVHGNVQQSIFAPLILIELVKNPEYFENLKRLDQVVLGGGPVPKEVGDAISSKTTFLSAIGPTETGVFPMQAPAPEDWPYHSVSPLAGLEYQHVSDDLYEQVVVRNPEIELFQNVFGAFPDLQEYRTKDLFSKHPTKDNLWIYRSRADDVIVFSTGEKLQPVDIETKIAAHPAVTGAIVIGRNRFQSSLLIEVAASLQPEMGKNNLVDDIWPFIQKANLEAPSYGRVHKDMILFTSADKPMLRAPKGTVQRKMTEDLYAEEIDALYKLHERNGPAVTDAFVKSTTAGQIVGAVLDSCTDLDRDSLDPDSDLFEMGLDSLQVTVAAKKLTAALSSRGIQADNMSRAMYNNPTLTSLITMIDGLLSGGAAPPQVSAKERMQALFEKFEKEIPISARKPPARSKEELIVLLTGSTGSMGSYILDSLSHDPRVSKIYCLNRGTDSQKRQRHSLDAKGLSPNVSKITYMDAKISEPYLGVGKQNYRCLLAEVTTVVHNAWMVSFNHTVDSFAENISSVHRLIEFSTQSAFGASIVFISSISSVMNVPDHAQEQIYKDWGSSQSIGYAQSKLIGERLMDVAAKEAGIPAVVCRIGQVGGPSTKRGQWPRQEWFPSLVASSKYLGKLPQSLGTFDSVDWVPVDMAGQIITELALKPLEAMESQAEASVYQVINPHITRWSQLAPAVAKHLSPSGNISLVPLSEWVSSLHAAAEKTEDLEKNPAVKLLDFFDGINNDSARPPQIESRRALEASPAMGKLVMIHDEWMENWMRQWGLLVERG